jgi:hypothetical protein
MKSLFNVFLFLLIIFTSPYIKADSRLCTQADACKCKSGEVTMPEVYATPGRGNKNTMYSCVPGLNPKKFLSCMSKLTEPVQECNCDEKIECVNDSGNLPPSLYTAMIAPADCKYKWKGFSMSTYKKVVTNYKADNSQIACTHSMCTSAVFLAWVNIQRKQLEKGKISRAEFDKRTKPGGKAYQILNSAAEPNELVEAYGLGKGTVQYASDGKIGKTNNLPKAGDLVQLWRKNSSGHSVVFKGFRDSNGDGRNDQLCYWSSQKKTNGYGNRCESINDMDRILIGSLNG